MADILSVCSATTLVCTGKGVLQGVAICSHAAAGVVGGAYFTDGVAPGGSAIFIMEIVPGAPYTLFFADRFAPRFATGLYLSLSANMYITVWARYD